MRHDNLRIHPLRTIWQRHGTAFRRWICVLLCAVFYLFATIHITDVHALTTIKPEKQPITDLAELLSSAEVESLQKEIEQVSFSFYLVTIPDLEGSSIDSFGRTLFQDWSLAGNDVLFIISIGDREAHMEIADESAFVRLIEQDPALQAGNPYSQLIDQTFIPHAIDGDFYRGIVQLIRQLEQRITAGDQGRISADQGVVPEPRQEERSQSTASVFVILIIAGIAVLALAILLWNQRQKFVKRKKQIKEKHRATLAKVHRIEQELSPTIQFSKGESERLLKSLQQRFYDLLQSSTGYVREVETLSAPLIVSKPVWQSLTEIEQKVEHFAQTAKQLMDEVDEYKKIESEVVRSVANYTAEWNRLNDRLTDHANEYGYKLSQLFQRGNDLKRTIDEAAQSVEFDPLRTKEKLQDIPEQLNELKQSIDMHVQHAGIFVQITERLQRLKRYIEQTIENERLLLIEIDPFALLKRMESTQKDLGQPIQEGDVQRSEQMLQQLDRWEQEIKDQLSRTIEAREWIEETLRIAMEKVSKYDDDHINRLEQQLKEVQKTYAQNHWSEIPGQIKQLQEDKQQIIQQLPEISHLAQIDVQKYFAGEKILQQVMATLQQMEHLSDGILKRKAELDQSFNEQFELLEQLAETLNHCEQKLRQHALPQRERWFLQISDARTEIQQLSNHSHAGLRDVTVLKLRVEQVKHGVEKIEQHVQTEINQFQETEAARKAFSQDFSRTLSASGSYINRNLYRRRYDDLIRQMDHSLSMGDYSLVRQCIETGNMLIAQMKNEYQTNLQRERERERQRMMRAAQAQMMRNQARRHSGFGGSVSPRSRGGSSSWGSSGSRGSRGGSSSFGSRSRGSRGGGSKW